MPQTPDKIYFNFSYKALKLLGEGLYSNPWTAIAELVANGIDAKAKSVYVYINMVNKSSSTIEVFDNGDGMTYDDLESKYTLIGKNKRLDATLGDRKNTVMGRKGIGKLAALYLSQKYFLVSRTGSEYNSWVLDTTSVSDNDIPHLKRCNNTPIESSKIWNTFETGTLLKLVNVNLENIGEQKIAGLMARLADYFADFSGKDKIHVGIKQREGQEVRFESAKKQIAYRNFYAFFNNTSKDFSDLLSKSVLISTSNPEGNIYLEDKGYYKECPVKLITDEKLHNSTHGEMKFLQENNNLSKQEFEYDMKGWIGIHTTIKLEEAMHNDDVFLKNSAYQPNRLRVYVRDKLAVENFTEYLKNTQAFSKYIEGEIHFNILDENELPDIATADRQNFKENNDRISLLVEILKPIVDALINARKDIGTQIRKEEVIYKEKLEVAAREAEDRQREAERKQREAEDRQREAERKQREAEDRQREAERKQREAEDRQREAERGHQQTKTELRMRKKQTYFLENALNVDERTAIYNTHVIKCNAEDIDRNLESLFNSHPALRKTEEMKSIAFATNKIIMTSRNFNSINYDYSRENEKDDLGYFIEQYFNSIAVTDQFINIKVDNQSESYLEFPYQDVTMMLGNVISNSKKASAKNLFVHIRNQGKLLIIKFIDDGKGIPQDKNLDDLFDLGMSYSRGTGIGLAQVKDVIERLKGHVFIKRNEQCGITLEVQIPNDY